MRSMKPENAAGSGVLYDYSSLPAGYYDQIYRHGSAMRRFWHQGKFETVSSLVPHGARKILDVGCGPGSMMSVLPGETRIGTDIAHKQIGYARRNYGTPTTHFCVSMLPDLPFRDDSMDVVTMVEILEHMPGNIARASLHEARRILRPGGVLIFTTPNYRSLWPMLEMILNRVSGIDYDDQHITRFNLSSARTALEDSGFIDCGVSSFFTVAPFLAPLSTTAAQYVHRAERQWLKRTGALVVGTGTKPS